MNLEIRPEVPKSEMVTAPMGALSTAKLEVATAPIEGGIDVVGAAALDFRTKRADMSDAEWAKRLVADASLPVEVPEGYVFNAKLQEELASIPPHGVADARKGDGPPPPILDNRQIAVPKHVYSNGIKWKVGATLGEGTYGKVFEVSHHGDEGEQRRIVKILIADLEVDKGSLWNEVGAAMAKGDYVGSEVITENNSVWAAIVMERYKGKDGGDLYLEIDPENPPAHDIGQTYKFAMVLRSMVSQLRNLHAAGWVHRDVKSENMIVDLEDGYETLSRLIDLGTAERIGSVQDQRDEDLVGTMMYVNDGSIYQTDKDYRIRDYWGAMLSIGELMGFIKRGRVTGGVHSMIKSISEGRFFRAPELKDPNQAEEYFKENNIEGAHREFLEWVYNFLQPHTPAIDRIGNWRVDGITEKLRKEVKTRVGTTKDVEGYFLNDDKFVSELEGHIHALAKQADIEVPEETLALLQEFPAAT
jgi:hypothetical protein